MTKPTSGKFYYHSCILCNIFPQFRIEMAYLFNFYLGSAVGNRFLTSPIFYLVPPPTKKIFLLEWFIIFYFIWILKFDNQTKWKAWWAFQLLLLFKNGWPFSFSCSYFFCSSTLDMASEFFFVVYSVDALLFFKSHFRFFLPSETTIAAVFYDVLPAPVFVRVFSRLFALFCFSSISTLLFCGMRPKWASIGRSSTDRIPFPWFFARFSIILAMATFLARHCGPTRVFHFLNKIIRFFQWILFSSPAVANRITLVGFIHWKKNSELLTYFQKKLSLNYFEKIFCWCLFLRKLI